MKAVVTSVVLIRFLASRSINQLRCWWSYALSLLGVVRVRHLPTFVSVEPANFCQLRCPECPVGKGKTENGKVKGASGKVMSMEVFEHVLKQVQETAHTMQFYFQGEPLLNKQLPAMIGKAHQAGLYTIVSTNAQALTMLMAQELVKSGLDRIIVSIDGFSEESYAAYRVGGSLHRALEGLEHLREAKMEYGSSIRIELQVLRLRTNEHEWEWIQRNYKTLGATHLVFKTAQLYDYEHGNPLMPSDERYSRYKKSADGTYHLRRSASANSILPFRRKWRPCYRLWSGCVITTAGDVLPCCYDKDHQHKLGNLTAQTLEGVWHGTKANALRKRILDSTEVLPEMCKNCDQ